MFACNILDRLKNCVPVSLSRRASEGCATLKSLKKRIFDASTVVFSAVGNWPFYGVAASFGNRYSPGLGKFLGVSEVLSYFLFRIKNFQEIRKQFFGNTSDQEQMIFSPARLMSGTISVPASPRSGSTIPLSELPDQELVAHNQAPTSRNWKTVALNTTAAALGIVVQFPIMILVYYGNEENLVYPLITGMCEGSFTILSLLLSIRSSQKLVTSDEAVDPEIERKKAIITEQIGRFLEELPIKYKDPDFVTRINALFSDDAQASDESRGRAVLDLILEAQGLPEIDKGAWDGPLNKLAAGLGLFIAGYLTAVNAAVTYKGITDWKPDQEALAVTATTVISLSNIHLLSKLCVDSAKVYYANMRDLAKGQYRPPLAQVMSPTTWLMGRTCATALSWSSFGTTGVAARDYVPKVGTALIGPAPVSSALLLRESLESVSDDVVLWASCRSNATNTKFRDLHSAVMQLKETIPELGQESLRKIFSQLPDLQEPVPRPRPIPDSQTPLLAYAEPT